jgi:hypothetical protein
VDLERHGLLRGPYNSHAIVGHAAIGEADPAPLATEGKDGPRVGAMADQFGPTLPRLSAGRALCGEGIPRR